MVSGDTQQPESSALDACIESINLLMLTKVARLGYIIGFWLHILYNLNLITDLLYNNYLLPIFNLVLKVVRPLEFMFSL